MAGKIIIDTERCKGCGLCISVCPKKGIVISTQSNKSGYFPAQRGDDDCTGCAMCAIICPEAVIQVFAGTELVQIKGHNGKKSKASLSQEQAERLTAK